MDPKMRELFNAGVGGFLLAGSLLSPLTDSPIDQLTGQLEDWSGVVQEQRLIDAQRRMDADSAIRARQTSQDR